MQIATFFPSQKIRFPEGLWRSPPSSSLSRTQPPAPAVQRSVLRAACHRGGWNSTAVLFKDVRGAVTLPKISAKDTTVPEYLDRTNPNCFCCIWYIWIYLYLYMLSGGGDHTFIYIHTHSFWHFVHLSTFFVQTIPPCQLCSLYTTGGLCSWVSSPLPLWAFRCLWCRCSGNAPLLIRAECVLDMSRRVSWSESVGMLAEDLPSWCDFFNLNASLVFISSGTSRYFFKKMLGRCDCPQT